MQASPGHLAKSLDHKSVRNMTLKDCLSPSNLHDGEPTLSPRKLEQFQILDKFGSSPNFYSHSHI